MLLVGDHTILDYVQSSNIEIYNLSSLKEGYPKLDILPTIHVAYQDEVQFDMDYFNWIFSNDIIFRRFFDIIYKLYLGENIFLLISKSEEYDMVLYSILKIIQQRYGYNPVYINNINDIEFISNDNIDFSIQGLYNLDMDKARYINILALAGELK